MHAFEMRSFSLSLSLSLSPSSRSLTPGHHYARWSSSCSRSIAATTTSTTTYFSLFPSLRPLRPQPPSSTAIGARQSIYIATRRRSGIGVARQRWKLGKKEAANRMAEEA